MLLEADPLTQTATRLLIATCRANPLSTDQHNHVPLAAGHYRMTMVDRPPDGDESPAACACYACEGRGHRPHGDPALPHGDIVIVVHGFNCTSASGIETAFHVRDALGAWGLPLAGPLDHARDGSVHVVGFTWPCEHTMFPGYLADKQAVARFASFSLANLITDLRRAEPDRRIHIVAHSMGCFLTLKALNMLAILHGYGTDIPGTMVDTVIWLAPDINADALERSTPASRRLRGWRHPGRRLPFARVTQVLARPKVEPAALHVGAALTSMAEDDHPLDGYGYAALNIVGRVCIYSSLNDEALWGSPLANHATEESGGASGGIRLGWCGPLRPALALTPDADAPNQQRNLTLVECTQVVFEHGSYFFELVTQHDLAAQLAASQTVPRRGGGTSTLPNITPEIPAVAPPTERESLPAWHLGAALQFPIDGAPMPKGLSCYALRPTEGAPQPIPGVPLDTKGSITAIMTGLWHSPLGGALGALIRFWRWYYRV